MAKQVKTAKVNMPLCVAGVLLCLTLFSFHLTGGLYARYTQSAAGGAAARVVRFGALTLEESGDFYETNKLRMIPGVDLTKTATVSFAGSESATFVFVEMQLPHWGTADNATFSFAINGKTALQWRVADGWTFLRVDGGTYVYYRELPPNTVLDAVDVIAAGGTVTVSETLTKSDMAALTGVEFNLRAGVVQSIGFDSPAAAYEAVVTNGRS